MQSCYRKLCIVVTEIGALLLPKSEHSRLPKSVHLSLPFTPSSTNQVRLEPTSYKLGLVGPNSNILCQINTVLTGCLQKILPLQTVQSCYRKLCIVVTEIGALLLPKSEHSRLPKSVHLSLPFTPSSTNQVRLEPTSYKLGLVGPNSNILCQINTVLTGCLQTSNPHKTNATDISAVPVASNFVKKYFFGCLRRTEEHRTERAFQTPLLQQLHCQHSVRYRRLLFLPPKALGRHRFC